VANLEHLYILFQGVEIWNQWREKHPEIRPDLREADLRGTSFIEINLSEVDLSGADLSEGKFNHSNFMKSNLSGANFTRAELSVATFSYANLNNANFSFVIFRLTDFRDANLSGAIFFDATLKGVDLSRADLSGTHLDDASLNNVDLSEATLTEAAMGSTVFVDVDLRLAKGLDLIRHFGPSTIGIDTIYRSQGHIPEIFLRGAGVPASFIEYMHSPTFKPASYYSCFISYSSQDRAFVEHLYADLQNKGVRCWYAQEDMRIGDEIRTRIDESIKRYDKLLLVLSAHALASDWVQTEVEIAFEKERDLKQRGTQQRILFHIRVDDFVMQTKEAWAADIRRARHIGDFTKWKSHDDYQRAFEQLVRDLKAEPSLQAS